MAYRKEYKYRYEPQWLDSAVGMVTKTCMVTEDAGVTDEHGNKTVYNGKIWPSNDSKAEGIIYTDVDVTLGDHTAPLFVAGRVRSEELPEAPSTAAKTALKNLGIVFADTPKIVHGGMVQKDYTAAAGTFTADNIATNEDGNEMKITRIYDDIDTAIATAALADGTVTITKVKAGSTKLTCDVKDVTGTRVQLTIPVTIASA